MSIIDADDPSQMAVFPRGGDGEWIPARVTVVGGRERGRGRVEVEVWRISVSLSHTHTQILN